MLNFREKQNRNIRVALLILSFLASFLVESLTFGETGTSPEKDRHNLDIELSTEPPIANDDPQEEPSKTQEEPSKTQEEPSKALFPLDIQNKKAKEPLKASNIPSKKIKERTSIKKHISKNQEIKSIIDLQEYKQSQVIEFVNEDGYKGKAKLINLNPNINRWYILNIFWPNSKKNQYYHLENRYPQKQKLSLDNSYRSGIVVASTDGSISPCSLWDKKDHYRIRVARYLKKPYAPLCDEKVYLRNKIKGYRTTKEWIVEFLRDNVWGGEVLTTFVKNTIYKDKFLLGAKIGNKQENFRKIIDYNHPSAAKIDPEYENKNLAATDIAIPLKDVKDKQMTIGKWHQTLCHPKVYASVIRPSVISKEIMDSHSSYVKKLDSIEKNALVYLVSFNLSSFNLGYAMGTEHPRLNWSARTAKDVLDSSKPGPDGIGESTPLVTTGLLDSDHSKKIIATFTGGFKRSHGAFKWGNLSKKNQGSHYGFIENGVVFSRLQPELASIIVTNDNQVTMKTWQETDTPMKPTIKFARQNGVPIIEYDSSTEKSYPGKYVSNWTRGNWSGSNDMKFRTLRAGVCLIEENSQKFLIYGYFSSVTPAAMARVFQAYNCKYAMHLDMNALEHTYLAVYTKGNNEMGRVPTHLVRGMKVLDERFKGNVPRFIGYPDNRDFFYLTTKDE